MLIPVTLSSTASSSSSNPKLPSGLVKISHDEILLIELQGSLEVELNHPRERDGKFIGKLKMDDVTSKPSLLIGNHLLEGKIAALPKPYAILVRNGGTRRGSVADPAQGGSAPDADAMQIDGDDSLNLNLNNEDDERSPTAAAHDISVSSNVPNSAESDGQGSSAGWTITGIVKKKIIFSKRPMPVTGKKMT